MVYLLKWLISLITHHTHDKEGKQGNSFIVRKAQGARASFSSLASKKGSSLLLVVMTMSVIIVISSSFMLLSFNTGIGSIFASSQQKAQLSCLSVAEGLKDGTNFGNVVDHYNAQLRTSPTNEAEFEANGNGLAGKTTVKLKATFNGSTYDSIKVTVTTVVGGSKYELSFMQNMTSDSIMDVINQVSNSMSVSGGGSFSMQTGQVVGDLSLNGDYLLAMNKKDNKPGLIDGNVYCNGSMVIGYRDADGNGISTRITKNLYVNGDLIINACEIDGDVYVSGNVLVNGYSKSEKANSDEKGPVIKGNLYVGGSLYTTAKGFSCYYPDKEEITGDKYKDDNKPIETGGFVLKNGFPSSFPSYEDIDAGQRAVVSINSNGVYTADGEEDLEMKLKNGETLTVDRDILSIFNVGKVLVYPRSSDFTSIFKGDVNSKAVIETVSEEKAIVVWGTYAVKWRPGTKKGKYNHDTEYNLRAYNALYNLLTGEWENDDKEHKYKYDSTHETTLKRSIVYEYEKTVLGDTCADNYDNLSADRDTLKVVKKVYVQGNAIVYGGNNKLGTETYVCGSVKAYTLKGMNNVYSNNPATISTTFTKLYTGKQNYTNTTLTVGVGIEDGEHYFEAYMSITGSTVGGYAGGDYNRTQPDEINKADDKGAYWPSNPSGTKHYYKFYQGDENDTFNLEKAYTNGRKSGSSLTDFWSENIGGNNHGKAKEGCTKVVGIFTHKAYVFKHTATTTINVDSVVISDFAGPQSKYSFVNSTDFDGNGIDDTEKKQMYSDMFLQNHNASSGLRNEQLRATTISTVADVFKEMGVYGYTSKDIYEKKYREGYTDTVKYYYDNLGKSNHTKYEVGANKLNDYEGVNFTGVTSATQVRFAYTLQKAMNATEKGAITVTGKGSIEHPGWLSHGDKWDQRILFKSGYKYNNTVGDQNIENLTNYWINGAGNIGDTFYGRLLFLGAYDDNLARSNNYSEVWRLSGPEKRWEAFNNDVKEVMGYLYNLPTCTYANPAEKEMWSKYRNYYAGVYAYSPDDKLHVYLMRDVVLGGDYNYCFGVDDQKDRDYFKDADDNKNGFKLYLDTSKGSVNVYFGSDEHGMLNFKSEAYIETTILFPELCKGQFNVGYVYLLPNFAMSTNGGYTYKCMTWEEKIAYANDMAAAAPTKTVDSDGQKIYKGASGNYYKYYVQTYESSDGKDKLKVLKDNKFAYIVRMWQKCTIYNKAIKDSSGQITAASIPFIMCEGPMLFMTGQQSEICGIIYSPNPKSVFFCASSTTKGTVPSSGGTFSGGAIVTGRVIGTKKNDATWEYFEDNTKYDVGKLLTEALIKADGGLGGMQTENGTDSSTKWSAGGYE